MAERGWYPDPGGQKGYRFWNGQAWSETLSLTPLQGPPLEPGMSASDSGQQGMPSSYGQITTQMAPKKSVLPWVLVIVGVLVVALIIWVVVGLGGRQIIPDDPDDPVIPTGEVCPKAPLANERAEHPVDDRVYGGDLSFPRLGAPWEPEETTEVRVPFGRDTAQQWYMNHPEALWGSSILVGELYAGDGFYEPEEASKIVTQCVFGAFYQDHLVIPSTLRSEPFTVDGFDGWITEATVTFSVPNLSITSELVIVIIVRTSSMSSSIFLASLPEDLMEYKPWFDAAIADLRVHS